MFMYKTSVSSEHLPCAIRYRFHALDGPAELFAPGCMEQTFSAGQEIFGEGEPVYYLYKVTQGIVRSYKLFDNGQRKIEAFWLPGDVFGLEADFEHDFCADAVDDVRVMMVRRNTVVGPAAHFHASWELWAAMTRELQRVQRHALLLARNGQERIANFLLEMSERLDSPDVVNLPMSRQDIADYLGLTIETVSRTMTRLVAEGIIALPASRQVVLCDRRALQRMNG
jgi:CRP/FNR family transcriptional regulator, nitrogen fixation regulation protein